MIVRIWHGTTSKDDSEKYLDFLLKTGTKEYRETAGNRSIKVWVKKADDHCDFFTVTEWDDLHAIKRFAGPNYENAVYYPEDKGILLEFEKLVHHYQCHDVSNTRIQSYILKLNQLMDGDPWLGGSFYSKLKNLDETIVFQEPVPGMNCIASLVSHCAYWEKVGTYRLEGDLTYRKKTIRKFNFIPVSELKSKGWKNIKSDFMKTHNILVESLASKTDGLLKQEYHPGYSYDYLIDGIIQHNAYHLGQIGLILRLLK